jgi:hypothetical protein
MLHHSGFLIQEICLTIIAALDYSVMTLSSSKSSLDSGYSFLSVLSLLGLSILCLILKNPIVLSCLFVLLLASTRTKNEESFSEALSLLWKLKFLFFFFLLIPILGEPDGLLVGVILCLQIACVILGSLIVRIYAGEQALLQGLLQFKLPVALAHSISICLELLSTAGTRKTRGAGSVAEKRGGGDGSGHGKGRQDKKLAEESAASPKSFKERLQLAIAHVKGFNVETLRAKISDFYRSATQLAEKRGAPAEAVKDIAVLSSIGAVMLSFKLIKILPGVAFFSGAKAVVFIPLYLLAAQHTKTRLGATYAGVIMGVIAFLNGDGRYGVFEIAKHVAPGLLIDSLWPLAKRMPLSIYLTTCLGLLAAFARTSSEFLMVFLLSASTAELYLFPAYKLLPNLLAGALSGLISYSALKEDVLFKTETDKPKDGEGGGKRKGSDKQNNEKRRRAQAPH